MGKSGIAAADKSLAGIVGMGDLTEVHLVEESHLQRPVILGERLDRRRPNPTFPEISYCFSINGLFSYPIFSKVLLDELGSVGKVNVVS